MSTTPPKPTNGTPDTPSDVSTTRTRTVAIIKNHALKYRLDIEPRIYEAGFEIVKERQMEFDTEVDPDFMYEVFGEDVHSLAEGPVWVYVLERRRAVEVWNTLMGDRDPTVARHEAPHSLRALYGISSAQNGLTGSADTPSAEFQITTIFNSSPPFSSSDLPSEGATNHHETPRSLTADMLASLHLQETSSSSGGVERDPSSIASRSGASGRAQTTANIKTPFRARPLPKTHVAPVITPRTTKAAALRAGQPVVKLGTIVPRAPLSKDALAKTFANVPGHKRTGTIQVASTAPPAIAPRMTKAASLRIGDAAAGPQKPRARPSMAATVPRRVTDPATIFDGVPGHRRRETISVVAPPPALQPKMNKSAALRVMRQGSGGTPPSSFMFRGPTAPRTPPGLTRRPSSAQGSVSERPRAPPQPLLSLRPPSIAPRENKSASLRAAKPKPENGTATTAKALFV